MNEQRTGGTGEGARQALRVGLYGVSRGDDEWSRDRGLMADGQAGAVEDH